jgi:hypothetical protein
MWRECRHSGKCAHAPLPNTHKPTATDNYASRPSCEPEKWDLYSHGSLDFPGQTAQVCTCTLSSNIIARPRETQHETRTVVIMSFAQPHCKNPSAPCACNPRRVRHTLYRGAKGLAHTLKLLAFFFPRTVWRSGIAHDPCR